MQSRIDRGSFAIGLRASESGTRDRIATEEKNVNAKALSNREINYLKEI